jgi:hypothetical protein
VTTKDERENPLTSFSDGPPNCLAASALRQEVFVGNENGGPSESLIWFQKFWRWRVLAIHGTGGDR